MVELRLTVRYAHGNKKTSFVARIRPPWSWPLGWEAVLLFPHSGRLAVVGPWTCLFCLRKQRQGFAVAPARRSAANAKAHLPATARKDSCTAAAKQLGFERKKIEPKRETVIVNGEERFVKVDSEIVAAK